MATSSDDWTHIARLSLFEASDAASPAHMTLLHTSTASRAVRREVVDAKQPSLADRVPARLSVKDAASLALVEADVRHGADYAVSRLRSEVQWLVAPPGSGEGDEPGAGDSVDDRLAARRREATRVLVSATHRAAAAAQRLKVVPLGLGGEDKPAKPASHVEWGFTLLRGLVDAIDNVVADDKLAGNQLAQAIVFASVPSVLRMPLPMISMGGHTPAELMDTFLRVTSLLCSAASLPIPSTSKAAGGAAMDCMRAAGSLALGHGHLPSLLRVVQGLIELSGGTAAAVLPEDATSLTRPLESLLNARTGVFIGAFRVLDAASATRLGPLWERVPLPPPNQDKALCALRTSVPTFSAVRVEVEDGAVSVLGVPIGDATKAHAVTTVLITKCERERAVKPRPGCVLCVQVAVCLARLTSCCQADGRGHRLDRRRGRPGALALVCHCTGARRQAAVPH